MADEYLKIDLSELSGLINNMRQTHTPENFQKLMYRAFARTATHVRTRIGKILPQDYEVKPMFVRSQIGKPQTTFTGTSEGVRCIIPLSGERGVLGERFKVGLRMGGAGKRMRSIERMENEERRGRKKYRISARLVNGALSNLPPEMDNQGGNPPFIMFSKIQRIPLVFTRSQRRKRNRQIIVRVVGLNVPRMPLNRSKEEVQKEAIEKLEERILHEHDVIMRRLATKK